jgi:hypothetical protein
VEEEAGQPFWVAVGCGWLRLPAVCGGPQRERENCWQPGSVNGLDGRAPRVGGAERGLRPGCFRLWRRFSYCGGPGGRRGRMARPSIYIRNRAGRFSRFFFNYFCMGVDCAVWHGGHEISGAELEPADTGNGLTEAAREVPDGHGNGQDAAVAGEGWLVRAGGPGGGRGSTNHGSATSMESQQRASGPPTGSTRLALDPLSSCWLGAPMLVAQTSSLLCRGFPIRRRWWWPVACEVPAVCRLEAGDTAGWKPALRWEDAAWGDAGNEFRGAEPGASVHGFRARPGGSSSPGQGGS